MIHHLHCNVPLETWRQWINEQLDKQAEELKELDKASVQNARIKVPAFIARLRPMMAQKLSHEALDYELDDGQHIALSHYLHELFDEHQVKMRELAEDCINAFNHIYQELLDCSLQIVDDDGNEDEEKIKRLSQLLNDYREAVPDEPVLVEADKVAAAYSPVADERERAKVMLEDYKILSAYLNWEFDLTTCPLPDKLCDRFHELKGQIDAAIEEGRLQQCTDQLSEAISILLAFETPVLIRHLRRYGYLIWFHALTDANLEFMRLTDKEEFEFANPVNPNQVRALSYTADEITGGAYKTTQNEIQELRVGMMDGELPNPDLDKLWDILHQRHYLQDVADDYWCTMLMTVVSLCNIDEYKLDGDVSGCFMGNRITNDASSPRFIVVSAENSRPAFTLISSIEDTENLTLSINVFDSHQLEQDQLDKVVDYLRDTMDISIEPKGDWEVRESAMLEAMLTDFDAMRKRGAWNKYQKLTE
ncbi:MAG: hypothetical protein IKW97_09140 [Muribaculaceae bacterium]|nr:hypothetical protein [Muribaculaceae bacterium]